MALHTLVPTYTKPKYSTVRFTDPKWIEENAKKVRMKGCLGRDLMFYYPTYYSDRRLWEQIPSLSNSQVCIMIESEQHMEMS
jgi:hypothetical protein